MTTTLTELERMKASVDPYAGEAVFARLARGAAVTPEDDIVLRWHGLYRHRSLDEDRYMLRLKLPGGAITAAQLAEVARLAVEVGSEAIHVTTRQDLQLYQVKATDLHWIFPRLSAAGLTSLGACGDVVRNVIGCPVAGIAEEAGGAHQEIAETVTAAFLGNPIFANLPRKFKIAVSGCAQGCVPVGINDLGLVAAPNAAGEPGFALLVGGGLSVAPALAEELGVWVAPAQVIDVVGELVSIFRDYGNREHRGRARFKHLLAARGTTWVRAELAARLGMELPAHTGGPVLLGGHHDHLGVHPQVDGSLRYIGIPVPAARLSPGQLATLAEWAAEIGNPRIRVTPHQNLILADVPSERVTDVLDGLATIGLPVAGESWRGRVLVCPGKAVCQKALVFTKERAAALVELLDASDPDIPVTLRMSGCPNGCGQHAIADLGLQGAVVRGADGPEEHFDLWAGGGEVDGTFAFARRLGRLPAEEVAGAIHQLLARYRREAAAGESFGAFARQILWEKGGA
jgi:sulfite reductase (ferredoxin)